MAIPEIEKESGNQIGSLNEDVIEQHALTDVRNFITEHPTEDNFYIVSFVSKHYAQPCKTISFRTGQIISNEDGSVDFYSKNSISDHELVVRKIHFGEDKILLSVANINSQEEFDSHGTIEFYDFGVASSSIDNDKCTIHVVENNHPVYGLGLVRGDFYDIVIYPADHNMLDDVVDTFEEVDHLGMLYDPIS